MARVSGSKAVENSTRERSGLDLPIDLTFFISSIASTGAPLGLFAWISWRSPIITSTASKEDWAAPYLAW